MPGLDRCFADQPVDGKGEQCRRDVQPPHEAVGSVRIIDYAAKPGSDERADLAYLKARLATEVPVATEGGAYLTVRDEDKENLVPVAQELVAIGFTLYATEGTADALRRHDVPVTTVYRIAEGKHPDALDLMRQGKVSFIVNVPTVSGGAVRDGNMMRRLAVELNIPFVTTMRGASMEVAAMRAHIEEDLQPRKLTVHY